MSLISDRARVCVIPEGIVSSDFVRVQQVAARLGFSFDEWQQGAGLAMLGRRADGLYACGVSGAVFSLPRQVGKTYLVGLTVLLLCASVSSSCPLTCLWTAHHTRTSAETFKTMQGWANGKRLAPFVAYVRRANGQEEIGFKNGSRILFGAREQGFGRGLSRIDIEVFDEAQILSSKALSDMVAATNASPNALIVYMGTPPRPNDDGEAFSLKREKALKQEDPDLLYVEFAADRTDPLDSEDTWRKANPSYPTRTGRPALLRLRNTLSDDNFRREALGVWDEKTGQHAVSVKEWARTTVTRIPASPVACAYALDMSQVFRMIAVGACARFEDGRAHIELAEYRNIDEHGTGWVVDWLSQRWRGACAVVVDAYSPATVLVPELKKRGVRVMVTNTRDLGSAVERFQVMLNGGTLSHLAGQVALDKSVQSATLRRLGSQGLVAWNKDNYDTDIAPLNAVTLALHGAYVSSRKPGRKARILV